MPVESTQKHFVIQSEKFYFEWSTKYEESTRKLASFCTPTFASMSFLCMRRRILNITFFLQGNARSFLNRITTEESLAINGPFGMKVKTAFANQHEKLEGILTSTSWILFYVDFWYLIQGCLPSSTNSYTGPAHMNFFYDPFLFQNENISQTSFVNDAMNQRANFNFSNRTRGV